MREIWTMGKYWECGICWETVRGSSVACLNCRQKTHCKKKEAQEAQAISKLFVCRKSKRGLSSSYCGNWCKFSSWK